MDPIKKIKKFYYGLNLNGNKIINAKTDDPKNHEDIANKRYVDKNFSYDTPLSNEKKLSLKFPWLQWLYGKPVKQVFDELIYPDTSYNYINPTLKSFKITLDDNKKIGNKLLSYYYKNIKGTFNFEFNVSDRSSVETTSIKVYNNNILIQQFNSNTTGNADTINFDILFKSGIKIFVERTYKEITVGKPSSNGNNIIPDEFKIPYIFKFDITNQLIGYSCIAPFWKRIYYEGSFNLDNLNSIENSDSLFFKDFNYGDDIPESATGEDQNIKTRNYCVGIKKDLFNYCKLIFDILEVNRIEFTWFKNNSKTVRLTYNEVNEDFVFFIADLGFFKLFNGLKILFEVKNGDILNLENRYTNVEIDYLLEKLKHEIKGNTNLTLEHLLNKINELIIRETYIDDFGTPHNYVGIKTVNLDGTYSVLGLSHVGKGFIATYDKTGNIKSNELIVNDGTYPPILGPSTPDTEYPAQDTFESFSKTLPASANIVRVLNDKVEELRILEDKQLVTPQIVGNWTTVPVTTVNSSKNIILERGYVATWTGAYKYPNTENYKLPTGLNNNDFPDFVSTPNTLSNQKVFNNITTNKTIKVGIKAPKNGFIVVNDKVCYAKGYDVTEDSVSVIFKDRIYFGKTPIYTDILTLETELVSSRSKTLTDITTNETQYLVFAYPKSLGLLSNIMLNDSYSIINAFTLHSTTVLNVSGTPIEYYLYRSNNVDAFKNDKITFN